MSGDVDMDEILAQSGVSINEHGGLYENGKALDVTTKIRVAKAYSSAKAKNNGVEPSINRIARDCQVSWHFANKVRTELLVHGRILTPREIRRNSAAPRGPGAKTLSSYDKFIILQLCIEEPSRSLEGYREWLYRFTGKNVSTSTIRRLLKKGYVHEANLIKPNLVPYDKFKPDNIAKALEYMSMLKCLDLGRVIFGDEKLLKGQELYNRKARINPITGEKPKLVVDPDFRITHSITAFTSLSEDVPVWYRIHEGNNDAEEFSKDVLTAIAMGFIKEWDVLVVDNAAYHCGKGNSVLKEWLWENHSVFLLFLPARAPEWNPVELVWSTLVQRLKCVNLAELRERYQKNAAAHAASEILDKMTPQLVGKFYQKCYRYLDRRSM